MKDKYMASKNPTPVAVVMGSVNDMGVVSSCIELLREFGIEPIVRVVSAHRTPQIAAEFADTALENGIKVIIAAAGMAAHLAGAMAGRTPLPIIGIPLASDPGLGGMDALLSTVQMPPGVPVASMAVGKAGAKNAALFAVQILSLSDEVLLQKLQDFRTAQQEKVIQIDQSLAP